MKTIITIILALLLLNELTANAQTKKDKKDQDKEAVEKKAAAERGRSFGGQQTENELMDDKGKVPVNQENKLKEGKSEVQDAQVTETLPGEKTGSPQGAVESKNVNVPSITQTTSSESGSPAILSKNNGQGRDGTNNVQRASINMAGAEIPGNLELSKKDKSTPNRNIAPTRVRKQEEQPAGSASEKISDKKENSKITEEKSDRKSRRKARKSRDSGK